MLDNVAEVERWGLLQHMRGFDKSGILFTDFRAAFPSILSSWMFKVLRAMGVPCAVIGFYVSLYRDSFVIVNFAGASEIRFSVGRGVRQGDPSSMTLFAMALDPVLRWIQYQSTPRLDLELAYADDCCFGLQNIL